MTDAINYPLAIELTPQFMSSAALRKWVSDSRWKEIRRNLIGERGLICEICSLRVEDQKLLDAHEVFIFLDDGMVQLEKIQLLCKECHAIKDFAHTERLIRRGIRKRQNLREILVEKFCSVNKCDVAAFNAHYDDARKKVQALEERYGPDINQERIHYGLYQSYYLKAQDPERLNTHTAASHAVADAVRSGVVHEGYREDIIEIIKGDLQLAERILQLVKANDLKASRALLIEELRDHFGDDAAIADDEPEFGGRA